MSEPIVFAPHLIPMEKAFPTLAEVLTSPASPMDHRSHLSVIMYYFTLTGAFIPDHLGVRHTKPDRALTADPKRG